MQAQTRMLEGGHTYMLPNHHQGHGAHEDTNRDSAGYIATTSTMMCQ